MNLLKPVLSTKKNRNKPTQFLSNCNQKYFSLVFRLFLKKPFAQKKCKQRLKMAEIRFLSDLLPISQICYIIGRTTTVLKTIPCYRTGLFNNLTNSS